MTPHSAAMVAEHVTACRARGQSPVTVEARLRLLGVLAEVLGGDLAGATEQRLEAWLAGDGWSEWTRATYAMHTRAFYRWALRAGYVPTDPAQDLRARPPDDMPNPVTDAQLHEALARTVDPLRLAILLGAYAGLRAGESGRLQREEVTATTLTVVRGKGGRSATLPTHPRIWAEVAHRPAGRLLLRPSGSPADGRWLSIRARIHFDAIGMDDVYLHRFRHWYATALLRNGVNIRVVQELMRHRSLATTQRYLAVADAELRAAVATL